jgi:hypothetical protein
MKAQTLTFSILTAEYPTERVLRRSLLILVGVLFVAYAYFVSMSVVHIIARTDAHTNARNTNSSIAALESEFYARSEDLTPSTAGVIGLVPVESKTYVTRQARLGHAAGANEI